ncbi:hypothetical protein IPZ58_11115 [Streptomyces roseoverticillatus]|uniref:hypothetical protein n=1 Tax=Streptomyces roseoverticillatus TaxID=66429 RepID=UPI001F32C3E8|nr:hypothetical protein [Streptomyces roseoverticillatus]MCF3102134.1 hypothetical protein [Streptomyces roseoverticillatus]
MSGRRKLFTAVATAALLGAPLVVSSPASAAPPSQPAAKAAAASCIGGAWKYDKPAGWGYAPTGSGYYVTTNRCADIQVKPDDDTQIELCYLKNHNPGQEVCKGRVTVKSGRWTILGTGFDDGAYFYFKFANTAAHKTGLVAA